MVTLFEGLIFEYTNRSLRLFTASSALCTWVRFGFKVSQSLIYEPDLQIYSSIFPPEVLSLSRTMVGIFSGYIIKFISQYWPIESCYRSDDVRSSLGHTITKLASIIHTPPDRKHTGHAYTEWMAIEAALTNRISPYICMFALSGGRRRAMGLKAINYRSRSVVNEWNETLPAGTQLVLCGVKISCWIINMQTAVWWMLE